MIATFCDICGKSIVGDKYILRLEQEGSDHRWHFFEEKHICSKCLPKVENAVGKFVQDPPVEGIGKVSDKED